MNDTVKEKAVDEMIKKLSSLISQEPKFFQMIDICTGNPTLENVNLLKGHAENVQETLTKITQKIDLFEEEAIFRNSQDPYPETIRSQNIGRLQHAVIEQIERLDRKSIGNRYKAYNKYLTKKIYKVNSTIEQCMSNLNRL